MKRKDDEKDGFCGSRSKLDPINLDLKMATVTRLPAKSLMKFRCVSKMLSSIIRSREFIDSFFSMSSTQSRLIVSMTNHLDCGREERLTFFLSFSHDEGEQSSSLVANFEMAIPVGLGLYPEGFASVHGFLAVKTDSALLVCNPSTEQVIKLDTNTRFEFLGYDPIGDQHKALSVRPRDYKDRSCHQQQEVLTLGGCQGWRHIEGTPGPYTPLAVGVCINGFLYYGARNSTN